MLFGRRGVTQNDIRYIFEASYFIKNIYRAFRVRNKVFCKTVFFGIPEYVILLIVGQNEEKSPAAELRLESNLNPVMYGFLSIFDT